MDWREHLRSRLKDRRQRGSGWVRLLDTVRLVPSAEGRARLWTRVIHRNRVHQTSTDTYVNRYPELFDLAARLLPDARRVLSFGCSTGEELISIRERFPTAEIIGAEINPRSRRMAADRVSSDPGTSVIEPREMNGEFDLIFAMAVLQREPHMIAETGIDDLSRHYTFERFDAAISELAGLLRPKGLLCVTNAHYPVEISIVADNLEPIANAPAMTPPLFGRDSRLLGPVTARTLFRKQG